MDLAGLDRAEIEALVESLGSPRFHARQIYQWIWKRGVTDIAGMTDLSRELRAALQQVAVVGTPAIARHEISRTAPESSSSGSATDA